jgi:hypothetical protein
MIWEALDLLKEGGEPQVIALALEGAAQERLVEERWEEAVRLFGAAEAYRESVHLSLTRREQVEHDRAISVLRAHLDQRIFAEAWVEGGKMRMEECISVLDQAPY